MATASENQSDPRLDDDRGALRRKVMLGQQDRQARAMSLPKALRLSAAKVADKQLNMAMAVIGARQGNVANEALAEAIPEGHLLLLLDGSRQRRAAALLDPALVGALVQQQTMATVMPLIEGETRKLTSTDAAICAPFLDALLAHAAELPEDPKERALISGYTFGARVEEPRLLLLALEAASYETVQLTLDIAAGTRQGVLTLLLPAMADPSTGMDLFPEDEDMPPAPEIQLDKVVLGLDVELRVAISAVRLPLGQVQSLRVGDILPLNVSAFDQACVETIEGRRINNGTLGQINGMRALQLEHGNTPQNAPRRRAADRAGLNLPQVSGDGTGTKPAAAVPALVDMSAQMPASSPMPAMAPMPDMPDLPDMADLPGLAEPGGLPDLPDLPDLPGASPLPDLPEPGGLPDLPDMSDLPGFAEEDELPPLPIGTP